MAIKIEQLSSGAVIKIEIPYSLRPEWGGKYPGDAEILALGSKQLLQTHEAAASDPQELDRQIEELNQKRTHRANRLPTVFKQGEEPIESQESLTELKKAKK